MRYLLSFLILSLSLVGHAQQSEKPVLVQVELTKAYIPLGYDSNDRVEIVVEGYFPNSCYRLGPIETEVNTKKNEIKIFQSAYVYQGVCLRMIVPFHQVVQLGLMEKGDYKIIDASNSKNLGELPIDKATVLDADDYLYASVRDAFVFRDNNKKLMAKVEGFYSNTCTKMKELRVIKESEDVLTILPIVENIENVPCNRILVPFTKNVELPELTKGRYLLNVRSLNGQAVNKLFDINTNKKN